MSKYYIPKFDANTVDAVSGTYNIDMVVITITGFSGPTSAVVTPDDSRAYVTNSTGNTVSVIDTATNTIIATIAGFSKPFDAAVSPDGRRVYVINSDAKNVAIIDTATNTIIGTTPNLVDNTFVGLLGAPTLVGAPTKISPIIGPPTRVAVSPDGTRLYVMDDASVYVIDATTNDLIECINGIIGTNLSFGEVTSDFIIVDGSPCWKIDARTNTLIGSKAFMSKDFI